MFQLQSLSIITLPSRVIDGQITPSAAILIVFATQPKVNLSGVIDCAVVFSVELWTGRRVISIRKIKLRLDNPIALRRYSSYVRILN